MCGIYLSIICAECEKSCYNKIAESCLSQLERRGPDVNNDISVEIGGRSCRLIGSVLWMQGSVPTPQPKASPQGNFLLWNGEIFNEDRPHDVSDTTYFSSLLADATSSAEVLSVIASVRGPFSLVYVERERGRAWFARDRIGRHSLLLRREGEGLAVSSVGGNVAGWTEIPTAGIFCLDITKKDLPLTLHPWNDLDPDPAAVLGASISDIVVQSPLSDASKAAISLEKTASEEYNELLSRIYAISIPQQDLPKSESSPFNETTYPNVGTTCLSTDPVTTSCVRSLEEKTCPNEGEDSLNNMIQNSQSLNEPTSPSDIQTCDSTCHTHNATPSQEDEELFSDLKLSRHPESREALALLMALSVVPRLRERADRLEALLSTAVRRRVETQPGLCVNCVGDPMTKCEHAKIGILFSGGLDSSVLAALADRWVPAGEPMELVNVSFERVRNSTHRNDVVGRTAQNADTPDRVTGKQTLEELRSVCPNRSWRFVKVDVPRAEMRARLEDTVAHLIRPRESVLDESLGLAVWFAARGVGTLALEQPLQPLASDLAASDSIPLDSVSSDSVSSDTGLSMVGDGQYSCSARVLLMGTGADEQLGGYSRHRKTLAAGGWAALDAEMRRDLAQLPARNLGRDDRCASDSGRAPRHPYLDESVVTYLARLPVSHRSWLTPCLPPGVGDKYLLRLVALRLGLTGACSLPKRAMQFGSRAADPRQRGDDPSGSLA